MSRVVLITGAARGIGAETARRLAAAGWRVALVGLEPEELARLAQDCPGAIWAEADVTDPAALRAAVDRTVAELGGIDACIANAGIAAPGFTEYMDEAAAVRTFDVNLVGVWRTVRYCLPHIVERRGYVLVVSSLAAIAHGPAFGPYAATKAGVEAFAESLRIEVAHRGVDVGIAYFSWIDTEMVRGTDRSDVWGPLRATLLPGPFGRTAPLADAAAAIVDAVLERRRVAVAPGWVRAASALRRPMQRIAELRLKRELPPHYARVAAAVAERGAEVSQPVGAGGEADRQASSERSSNQTLVEPA